MTATSRTRVSPAWGLLLAGALAALPVLAAQPVKFSRDVQPILARRCLNCHSGKQAMGGLRLDDRNAALKGGTHGPVLVPGKAAESRLIGVVAGTDRLAMPPTGKRLTPREIGVLTAWVNEGAAWEGAVAAQAPHWAFQAPNRPVVPAVRRRNWVRNPIDAFVAAEQERRGLTPRAPADRSLLLRRVYLDLVGLPPTRAELLAFLADTSPDAYEKVVDRLLASPHYGERWARHWMDVWRYSDWYGRRAVPDVWNSAPQIWRWRDWIVRSLNEDRGYDRMVQEMLAGDELAPGDPSRTVATGYLVRNWYALNPNQWMRDNVEHTGKAFLGLTLNCAHCHDHKYDPVTQEEYFRFRAFFEPLQLRQDRLVGEGDPGPFQKYDYSVLRKVVKLGTISVFDERMDSQTFMYEGGDERNRTPGRGPVSPGVPAFLGLPARAVQAVTLPVVARYPGADPALRAEERAAAERAATEARQALEGMAEADPDRPVALAKVETAEAQRAALEARIAADDVRFCGVAGDASGLARQAAESERTAAVAAAQHELVRAEREQARAQGKPDAVKKAETALAAAKKALEAARKPVPADKPTYRSLSPTYPEQSSGRRSALAAWIADRRNPLTARVAVNHLWKWHFGRPLVDTVTDFGRNGKAPSHPALLDWLATFLMEGAGSPTSGRWTMKRLHRLIVTSNTYRTASDETAADAANLARDEENRFLWRFPDRRVEAEVVRDSTLAVAGELDRAVGGPVFETDQAEATSRRSLYFACYPEDGGAPSLLRNFDPPSPAECYRRSESIMPQQALVLTNSPHVLRCSRVLARRLWEEVGREPTAGNDRDAAFLRAAFEQVLTRAPSPTEFRTCTEFLQRQQALFRAAPAAPEAKPGTHPPSADPAQRAREGLVRALFNHHEFITLR